MTRPMWLRGALMAVACAVVASCDRSDGAPAAVRPAGLPPTQASPPPVAEAPYKHDDGDAEHDLVVAASTYTSPHYEKTGRLPAFGDTKCLVRRADRFEADGRRYGIVAIWASAAEDCSGPQAIILSLQEMQSDNIAEDDGRTIIEIIGSQASFSNGPLMLAPMGRTPPKAFVDQRQMTSIDRLLRRLTALRPFTADRLPPWPDREMQPLLPDGVPDELTFQPFADRQTYEAARGQRAETLCWKPVGTSLRCFVEAPRRRPAQVLLFAVHGYNAFAEANDGRAIAMMLKRAP